MSAIAHRQADQPVEPLFIARWSQRAYTGEPIPDDILFSAFEAARWAPSGGNAQPWRFIYTRPDDPEWPQFLSLLNERNRLWAENAGVLILVLSRIRRLGPDGEERPSRSHSFDAGAAWSNLAHQLHLHGWSARAIGGFDRDATRTALAIPEQYALEVFIAAGRPADKSSLPLEFQDKETPTTRVPIAELVSRGTFAFR